MNVLLRHVRRAYSTSRAVQYPSALLHTTRLDRADKYIQILSQHTQNPKFELLSILNGRPDNLSEALTKCNISLDEYNRWKPVLAQADLDSALEVIKAGAAKVDPKESPGFPIHSLPTWVSLFLTGFRTRSHQQAYKIARALIPPGSVFPHENKASKPHSGVEVTSLEHPEYGALLILNAVHLARYNLLVPLRDIVKTFISSTRQHSPIHLNLLLQALSLVPSYSSEIETAILSLLNVVRYQRFDLWPYTFQRLMKSSVAGPKLAVYFKTQLSRKDPQWHLGHHEEVLRLLSKLAGDSRLPLQAVKEQYEHLSDLTGHSQSDNPPVETKPPTSSPTPTSYLADPQNRASMRYMMAHKRREEANRLFNDLLKAAQTQNVEYRADIYTFTAALSIAAKDFKVSDKDLLRAFRHIPQSIKPTSTTYSTLIRGLFERKSPLAAKLWDEFCTTGLPLDKYMLSLGLRVLTREGKPHAAFTFLETFTRPVQNALSPAPIKISVVTVNDYLVALNRINRPDLVHFLFDHMWTLFHVLPDSRSLSILLFGTRIMRRLDNSIAGVVAEFSLRNPFRSPQSASHSATVMTRREAIQAVAKLIGTPEAGTIPYKPRIWHNQTAVHRAITIFQQAMFGNNPDLLRTVRSPVYAVRSTADEDPAAGFGGLLPKFARPIDPTMDNESLNALLNEDGTTRYPSITINNDVVIRGIILLGLGSRVPEIPLMLAWMKALHLRPSRATFAAALAFWEEVSFEAPLVEKLSGEENNQYTKLWNWMKDWVGEEGMPDKRLMWVWQENLRKLKAG